MLAAMRLLLLLLAVLGCNAHKVGDAMGAGVSTPVGVAVATTAAMGTSLASRALGGCYAICQQGETCNPRNGYCEPLPCRGECGANERCDQSGAFGDKCIPGAGQSVAAERQPQPASQAPTIRVQVLPPVPEPARPSVTP